MAPEGSAVLCHVETEPVASTCRTSVVYVDVRDALIRAMRVDAWSLLEGRDVSVGATCHATIPGAAASTYPAYAEVFEESARHLDGEPCGAYESGKRFHVKPKTFNLQASSITIDDVE